jgi:hypothetical protein
VLIETSHGPPAGPIAGWLDLYRGSADGSPLAAASPDVTLESAIDYGLELMGIPSSTGREG